MRTEVDAVMKNNVTGEDQTVTLKALNEFDSKAAGSGGAPDWRSKLTAQRGAVLATEMKNNNCKLARWATQAILARADVMKLGFVSRVNPRSAAAHVILGVLGYKPREFATQMNLNIANGWGIVRTIVDLIRRRTEQSEGDEEEGGEKVRKYILVKDPNKPVLRIYGIPPSTFEEDEDAGVAESQEKGDEDEE
jgi:translation initiation factor 3 subunit D